MKNSNDMDKSWFRGVEGSFWCSSLMTVFLDSVRRLLPGQRPRTASLLSANWTGFILSDLFQPAAVLQSDH